MKKDDQKIGEELEEEFEDEEDIDWGEIIAEEIKRRRIRRLRRWIVGLLIYVGSLALLFSQVRLAIMETPSIPYRVCLQVFNLTPHKGDLCVFEKRGFAVFKYLAATEGDRVSNVRDDIFINGEFVCHADRREGLTPADDFTVPAGYVFVLGSHEESFDSRYREFGLVKLSELKGRALGLWKW
jgi:conjugal transfer pilin signal peptidase TrbI